MFDSFHSQGVEAFKQGNFIQEKKMFLQAISLNDQLPDTFFLLGKACFFSEEKKEAIPYLVRFIELTAIEKNQKDWACAFDLLGQCFAADNQDEIAITYYFAAIENDFNCVSARYHLALSYMKLAQEHLTRNLNNCFTLLGDAHIALDSALELCSDNPLFLNTAAGWHKQFIDLLKHSEEKNTQENISIHFMCALYYYHEALGYCHKVDTSLQVIRGNLIHCYCQFGDHLYQKGELIQAYELYSAALELEPHHIHALKQTGMCLFKQGMYREARIKFATIREQATDRHDKAHAWLNTASCYRMERNLDEAEQSLNQAKKITPLDPEIDKENEKLKLARAQSLLIATSTFFVKEHTHHTHNRSLPSLDTFKQSLTQANSNRDTTARRTL